MVLIVAWDKSINILIDDFLKLMDKLTSKLRYLIEIISHLHQIWDNSLFKLKLMMIYVISFLFYDNCILRVKCYNYSKYYFISYIFTIKYKNCSRIGYEEVNYNIINIFILFNGKRFIYDLN